MTRLLLIVPVSGFGTEEGKRLAAFVRLVNRAAELAGFEVIIERALGARLPPACWSGEFRTGDEVNTVRVVDGRIVSVA